MKKKSRKPKNPGLLKLEYEAYDLETLKTTKRRSFLNSSSLDLKEAKRIKMWFDDVVKYLEVK